MNKPLHQYFEEINTPLVATKEQWHGSVIVTICFILGLIILLLCGCRDYAWAEIDLRIIAQIESSNNPNAYNKGSGAVGLYQITAICLEDYNQTHRHQFQLNEMFDAVKAEVVARWYLKQRIPALLRHYHIEDTLENRLWAYNAGIGRVVKGIMPEETKNYIIKYERLSRRINVLPQDLV